QAAARNIMSGGQRLGAEVARGGKEVAELDGLIALDAGHRGLPRRVAFGEAVDHRLLEAVLVVQHVMRDPDALGDGAGVMNVLPGTTGARAMDRGAVVIELERDADDVVLLRLEQRRRDR